MRIVFMGTPQFAVPSFEALIAGGYEVAGAFTQPDRPAGRGRQLAPCPVKAAAARAGVPVFQFQKIRSDEGAEALSRARAGPLRHRRLRARSCPSGCWTSRGWAPSTCTRRFCPPTGAPRGQLVPD
jgi:hypothetical protein